MIPLSDRKPIRVALASSKVTPSLEQNFLTVAETVKRVGDEEARIVCFPECALGGPSWNNNYRADRELAVEIPGPVTERVAELARVYGIYVAIGLLEREGPRLYDSAVLFNHIGEMIHKYRRMSPQWHAPGAPKGRYGEGDEFSPVNTPLGIIGLAICGDTGDPAVVPLIRRAKPDWLIVPRNANFDDLSYDQERWDREKAEFCHQALDIGVTAFFVNAYSEPSEGWAYGGSMIVSAQGQILAESRIGAPSILLSTAIFA